MLPLVHKGKPAPALVMSSSIAVMAHPSPKLLSLAKAVIPDSKSRLSLTGTLYVEEAAACLDQKEGLIEGLQAAIDDTKFINENHILSPEFFQHRELQPNIDQVKKDEGRVKFLKTIAAYLQNRVESGELPSTSGGKGQAQSSSSSSTTSSTAASSAPSRSSSR